MTDLQTPAGQFQLDLDPVLFGMSQELVAEEAAKAASHLVPVSPSPPRRRASA